MTVIGLAFDGNQMFAFSDSVVTRQDQGQYINIFRQGVPTLHPPTDGFVFDDHYQKLYILDDKTLIMVAGSFDAAKSLVINANSIVKNYHGNEKWDRLEEYLSTIAPADEVEYISCFVNYDLDDEPEFIVKYNVSKVLPNDHGKFFLGGSGSEVLELFFNGNHAEAEKFGIKLTSTLDDKHSQFVKILNALISIQVAGVDFSKFRFGGWYETAYYDPEERRWKKLKYSISTFSVSERILTVIFHSRVIPHDESTLFLNFYPGLWARKGLEMDNLQNLKSFLRESPVQLEYDIESIFNEKPVVEFLVLYTEKSVSVIPSPLSLCASSEGELDKVFHINYNEELLDAIRNYYRDNGEKVGDLLYHFIPND
jgi:hypothetical protein